jgi:hypothetical protein
MTNEKRSGIPWGLVAALGLLSVVVLSACAVPGLAGANATPSPSLSRQQAALKFAQCMRVNGVPNFPDPTFTSGGINSNLNGSGIDPNSPTVQKAREACKQYEQDDQSANPSANPSAQAQSLKYARCMRANGVPNFPDPDASGGISLSPGSGLDPNDPAFQKAARACQSQQGQIGTGGGGQ